MFINGLHLEEHLVSGPAGHIPAGSFFGAQYRITDVQVVKHFGKGRTDLLVTVVKGPGASHP
jgi:hypothetical protein